MLHKVELLVGGLDDEVVADRRLVGALGPERRVGEDDVEALAGRSLVDRVTERNMRLDLVEVEVHQGQPARPGDELLTVVGPVANALHDVALERTVVFHLEPLVGSDEEAPGAAGRVADREVFGNLGIRLHQSDDRLDQRAGREVLAGPLLALGGCLLEQPLERSGLDIHLQARPLRSVDGLDQPGKGGRAGQPVLAAGEDVAEDARSLTKRAQGVLVGLDELDAALRA